MKKWFGILVMGTALLFMLSNINTEKTEVVVEEIEEIVEPAYEYDILGRFLSGYKRACKKWTNHGRDSLFESYRSS